VQIGGDKPFVGAGVIARADEHRSFLAFYVVTDDSKPEAYSIRAAIFKHGRIAALIGLKSPIDIPGRQCHISLQFFSADAVGIVTVGDRTHTLKCLLPEVPFRGLAGVVRFYNSSVLAHGMQVERITMKPILPEEGDSDSKRSHPFRVFLSHSSSDKALILKVTDLLKEASIPYWVDHEQITFGDGIVAKIEEGLQKSKFVVACISKSLVASGWCRAEYGAILYREFSGDTSRRVIPLSLDGSEDAGATPLLLSDKMRADFTNPASMSAFIEFLQKSA
jgi:hypothetical protein